MKTKTKSIILLTLLLSVAGMTKTWGSTNLSLRFTADNFGTISSNTTIGEFTIYATSDKTVKVDDASTKTIDGVEFTHCLKLGGSRSSTYRLVGFHVDGPCTIKTYGQSASTSTARNLVISSSSSTPLGTALNSTYCVSSSTAVAEEYNYTGEAANIYIGSYNSGYNIYGIDVTYSDGETTETSTSSTTTTNPAAGTACTFDAATRYSQLVINSRISDFYGNTKKMSFAKYTDDGTKTADGKSSELDYVPGLVAKAILETVDYYKDNSNINVKPWFYAVQDYAENTIKPTGIEGKSFDDLNAVKLYFKLKELASSAVFSDAADTNISNSQSVTTANTRLSEALAGISIANSNYSISADLLPGAAGGWWHKSGYTNQMWCDGQYMGPALLAQMLNEYEGYTAITGSKEADWDLVTKQFTISWNYLWNPDVKLLYHAFTADPECTADTNKSTNASKWAGFPNSDGVYHSAEYWGRAEGWYFLALVDVLEQMQKAGLTKTANYATLYGYLNELAAGIAAKQDATTGCWYQLLNHDGTYVAETYDSSYRYTAEPVANYLESSATAIFTAAYLKGTRLGLFSDDYTAIAKKAYKGIVENFMVADGNGGVHLVGCCKSAGLGGPNFRDGSAEYYLMGKDTQPTVANPDSASFYTEGKVLGGFILAATEYERMFIDKPTTSLCEDNKYNEFTEGEYAEVSLLRSIPQGEWSTLVLPFDLTATQLAEAFGDAVEVAVINRISDNKLYFSKQTALTANEPVLINISQKQDNDTYTFNNVTMVNSASSVYEGTGVSMIGSYSALTGGQNGDLGASDYFIYDNKFYDCSYMNTMKAFRAYITATTANAKQLSWGFVDEDNSTAVDAVVVQAYEADAPLYNVAGQRVGSNYKGLTLQKGMKVLK